MAIEKAAPGIELGAILGPTPEELANQAAMAKVKSERKTLEVKEIFAREDPFEKTEREHQQALGAQKTGGGKSQTAGVGKGPQAGDAGVGSVAGFFPVSIKG